MKNLLLYKVLGSLVLIVLLNLACSSDHFYNTIELEDRNFVPQLAIQAVYTMGENDFYVYASKTQNYLSLNVDSISFEARLEDSDGLVIFDSSCVNCLSMVFNIGSSTIKEDQTYSLIVSSDGVETAIANVTPSVKPTLDFNSVDFKTSGEIKINFDILDHKGINEFYRVERITIFAGNGESTRYFYPPEEVSSYFEFTYPGGTILPDISFDGETFRVVSEDQIYNSLDSFSIEIIVQNWSQELYEYGRNASATEEAEYNPFFEPVSIGGNFDKGLGIFAIIQQDTILERVIL